MIRFLTGTDLFKHAELAKSMFRDRKVQFKERLDWPVTIEQGQFERDQYDAINPYYVILENDDGSHGGSMRLMPTVGRTMINDYFLHALGGEPINEAKTWECTRFCMSPRRPRQNPVALFAAAGYLMRDLDVKQLVAVFDKTMIRSYRLSGVEPHVIGEMSMNTGAVHAGIWSFSPEQLTQLTKKSGRPAHEFELSLANASFIENRHLAYG